MRNLDSAMAASLLMLPDTFDAIQLFEMISSLSYIGNFPLKTKEQTKKNERGHSNFAFR
jgi:hypothetical protein